MFFLRWLTAFCAFLDNLPFSLRLLKNLHFLFSRWFLQNSIKSELNITFASGARHICFFAMMSTTFKLTSCFLLISAAVLIAILCWVCLEVRKNTSFPSFLALDKAGASVAAVFPKPVGACTMRCVPSCTESATFSIISFCSSLTFLYGKKSVVMQFWTDSIFI